MKNLIKRITAVSICVLMLFPMLLIGAFAAVSENEGMDAIRAQWSRSEGPNKDGYNIDYSYFSPIANGASEEQEYPLLVILPGFGESTYEGEELTANEFPLWSSAEYQEKFHNGGAYIMIARAPAEPVVNWNSSLPIPALKAAIDDFCSKNPNVDAKRIYAMGWSYGASGAIRLTANYKNFIAALLVFAPVYTIRDNDAYALRNRPVWMFGCKKDTISIFDLYVKTSWNSLLDNSLDSSKIRLTTTETAPNTSGMLYHKVWDLALKDMTDNGGCTGVNTIDGYGSEIKNPSVIGWLSDQVLVVEEDVEVCSHICHKDGILGFLYKIIRLFWQLFSIQKTCSCGIEHY